MKITDNLKNLMKGFKGREKLTVDTLSKELQKTPNSIRASLSVPNYKKYFVKVVEFDNKLQKNVQFYSLSQEGQNLIDNDFKIESQEENN